MIVEQSHANSHRTDPIFDKDEFPPDLPELGSKGNDDISIGDHIVCLGRCLALRQITQPVKRKASLTSPGNEHVSFCISTIRSAKLEL